MIQSTWFFDVCRCTRCWKGFWNREMTGVPTGQETLLCWWWTVDELNFDEDRYCYCCIYTGMPWRTYERADVSRRKVSSTLGRLALEIIWSCLHGRWLGWNRHWVSHEFCDAVNKTKRFAAVRCYISLPSTEYVIRKCSSKAECFLELRGKQNLESKFKKDEAKVTPLRESQDMGWNLTTISYSAMRDHQSQLLK